MSNTTNTNPDTPPTGDYDTSLKNILSNHSFQVIALDGGKYTEPIEKDSKAAINSLIRSERLKAKIEGADELIGIYNELFEPNGEFRSFGSLKKEDVAALYLRIGEHIRDLQQQLNELEAQIPTTTKKGTE